ncbi:MAG: VWA domain-containing protein [Planctomycetota bacterium]|nr:VWA domain-containing protein [Planctomycetota bacterium]
MNWLKRLSEWLLDARPSSPGQGTSWNITHDFPWPSWGLAVFLVLATLFVVAVYRRDAGHLPRAKRGLLVGLRLATIAVVLFLLSQALLSVERTGLPYVLVLLDVSNSMGTVDRYQQPAEAEAAKRLVADNQLGQSTRLAQAQALLLDRNGALLRSLIENHKLRFHTIAEGDAVLGEEAALNAADIDGLLPKIRELVPGGNETRLGDGLRNALNSLRGTPPSAAILLTDGISTDGESLQTAAQYARQRSVPLFAVALGSADPVIDLELHNVLVDDTAFVGEPVSFAYTLTARGLSGKTARVNLRNSETGETLATRDVRVADDGKPQKQELSFTPNATGELSIVIEAVEQPQESNTANNRETRHISVRDEKLKVLLVDRVPRWEFRQLKDLLGREKTVELKTVLLDADDEFVKEDRTALPRVPQTREELFEYDVCILGDLSSTQLTPSVQENLRDFVGERGRGMLFIAGPNHSPETFAGTPLESLLPIELAGVRKPGPNEI